MYLDNKKILSLCGGGIRGIAHLGVIKYLEEVDALKNINIFAGTSVGAIICGLIVIGYTSSELYDFILKLDCSKIFQLGRFDTIINKFGFDKGSRFDYILKKLITCKGYSQDVTLKELYEKTKKKLIVTVTNLKTGDGEYVDYVSHPNLSLRMALRMSSCIPVIYTPINYNNQLYIDGGCAIPLPISLFKDSAEELIAINLKFDNNQEIINNLEDYVSKIFNILYFNMTTKDFDPIYTIINIKINVFFITLNLTDEEKKEIFDTGYQTFKKIIEKKI